MVFQCCVYKCKNSSDICNRVPLFRFPKIKIQCSDEKKGILVKRREAWFNAIKIKGMNINKLDGYRVCAKHFSLGWPSHYMDVTHPDWVPHLNMGYPSQGSTSVKDLNNCSPEEADRRKLERYQRRLDREKRIEMELLEKEKARQQEEQPMDIEADIPQIMEADPETGISIQTIIDAEKFAKYEVELTRLREENIVLKRDLNAAKLNEEAFINNDAKLKFYTGLPNLKVFNLILGYVDEALKKIKIRSLSSFQKLMLTLMKLRLNTSFIGLGYRFEISAKSAGYLFQQVILILEHTFDYLVHWPNQKIVSANMPVSFKKLYSDKVVLIIDCFEIKSQKPSLMKSQLQAYSPYKSAHTTKYLIGITPQGFISYISDGWGGRTSDKKITESCGILDNLKPGDFILADRGFTVHELVAEKQERLLTAAFTKNKVQLSPKKVEETAKIESVRIHVERVTDSVRNKFKILNGPIPISILKCSYKNKCLLDYIVKCCCIFNNICPSVTCT